MSKSRLELKVGAFVMICLVLLAVLLIQFSKGMTIFHNTNTIILETGNVGGLKTRAAVLISGVTVGAVSKTELSPSGTNVAVYLSIFRGYTIRHDARFVIEQSGFLGDPYVAIYPGENKGEPFKSGETAHVEEPFNLQEAVRSANGFIKRMDATAKNLNDAISDVRRTVLNEETLTNLSITIANFRKVSEGAIGTVSNLDLLVVSNRAPVELTMSNLVAFSVKLDGFAQNLDNLVTTNAPQISLAVSNLQSASADIARLTSEAEAGKGVAGTLLKNEVVATDLSQMSANLSITASNMNQLGLWRVLFPKHPAAAPAPNSHTNTTATGSTKSH